MSLPYEEGQAHLADRGGGYTPGFERGRNLRKMGREAQDTSELFFEDVRVPAGNLLGEEGRGLAAMRRLLPQERLVIAAMGQSMMARALALTLDHAGTRSMFGGTLFDLQTTQFVLATPRLRSRWAK